MTIYVDMCKSCCFFVQYTCMRQFMQASSSQKLVGQINVKWHAEHP